MTRRACSTRVSLGMAGALAAAAVAGSIAADLSPETPSARYAAAAASPSKLDYLVLASMADSPHLLSIARFHSTGGQGAAAHPDTKAPNRLKSPSHSE